MVDYSKWKDIEVSDDEDDTHPNIDTASLHRWRHQARIERMAELEREKKEVEERKKKIAEEKAAAAKLMAEDSEAAKTFEDLKLKEKEVEQKEVEVKKKEKLTPWNVDTLSKDGFTKTVINKPKPRPDTSHLSEEEKEELYRTFVKENEVNIKRYGMLSKWEDCKSFLTEFPNLVCEDTANYLAIWCLNLEMDEKTKLMEHVSKQVVAMQYILELAKQLDCDPRSCISAFFTRIQLVDKQYQDAFEDELSSFKTRIKDRAKAKMQKIMEEIEEEERQKRLGPGGLDPAEVFESLPQEMQDCFEKRDIALLQELIGQLDPETAAYHMKRCVDSGLWIPDAKAAGVTPAAGDSEEAVYETIPAASSTKAQQT
ncbi:Hsp90 co-chaperone Cdc37 [Halotydeus destructor]|nr:Hsp90 co-chaperone Cdc37 [Halotydeus destructor]